MKMKLLAKLEAIEKKLGYSNASLIIKFGNMINEKLHIYQEHIYGKNQKVKQVDYFVDQKKENSIPTIIFIEDLE